MRKVKVPQDSQLCASLPHLEAGTHFGPYVLIEPQTNQKAFVVKDLSPVSHWEQLWATVWGRKKIRRAEELKH